MNDSNSEILLNDSEVLTIVKSASKAKNVSVVCWTLKQKDGELTGFLGEYWKLHVEAVVVRIFVYSVKIHVMQDVKFLQNFCTKFLSLNF